MKGSRRPLGLVVLAAALAILAGCPLPFEYNGKGATTTPTSDPSSPNMTAPVTVSYTDQGGSSGTIADGGLFTSGQTTTVTLSTASLNAVIFYTTDGTALTNLRTAQKINASSGTFTITRATTAASLDVHAIAVGPNMLPSPSVHVTVTVSPYPILTVSRANASISEDGGSTTFTVTSSVAPVAPLTVSLQASGTYHETLLTGIPAAKGIAFTRTIAASATTTTVTIAAQHDQDFLDETITLTILPDSSTPPTYSVGAPANASVSIQDDVTPTYTVTYDGNGNTGGSVPTDGNSYVAGAPITVAGQGSLVRSGSTFAGWNTAQDGTGTPHAAGSSMAMGSADIVLYAFWTPIPTYSVTYNGNGGTGGTVPTDGAAYHTGDTATILPQGTLSQSGSVFAGWNTAADASGATLFGGNTIAIAAANVVLYAIWLPVSGTTISSVPPNATNVVIPEGITGIGTAFRDHLNLVSVTLPSTLTTITIQAFLDCPQLTTLVSNNSRYQVMNGALVDTQNWDLMLVPAKLGGAFAIPAPVVSIDPYAFDFCTNLTSITIPPSMTAISGNGFSGLRSAIPIVLPPTVTTIGAFAFYNSFVTSIAVSPNVTTIGDSAMGACPDLVSLFMQGPPPALGASVFTAPPVVHVPDLATQVLYLASPWAAQAATIVFP